MFREFHLRVFVENVKRAGTRERRNGEKSVLPRLHRVLQKRNALEGLAIDVMLGASLTRCYSVARFPPINVTIPYLFSTTMFFPVRSVRFPPIIVMFSCCYRYDGARIVQYFSLV